MTMINERIEHGRTPRDPGKRTTDNRLVGFWIPWLALFGLVTAPAPAKVTSGGASLETQWVEWALFPENCPPTQGGTLVACGDYGSFVLDATNPGGCSIASGAEQPPAYVQPTGPTQPTQPTGLGPRRGRAVERLPSHRGLGHRGLGHRGLGPTVPCVDGSCFEPPGGTTGDEPWLALIDWNTEHGWTTGWTAMTLSGQPVHLYPLDGPDLAELLGPAVGDAHLLVRLCEVAEAVDHQRSFPAPVAINMSFGRVVQAGHDNPEGGQCDPANLSCQIARLLEHLASRGVVSTAAAGNYAQVQFPASYDAVLAVGNLDLARFAAQQTTAPAWETPPASDVLLPGYGVCLEPEDPMAPLWPAPPGSSYASALFAGWMAHTLQATPVNDPTTVDWALRWSATDDCFVVSNLQPAVCNPVANRLLDRILGNDPTTCWTSGFDTWLETHLIYETAQQGLTQQMPSLVEWVELGHVPTPESDPCVPCVDDGFNQSLTGGNEKVVAPLALTDLLLDLSASSPLRPFLTLEALHLRIDEDYYPLLDRQRAEDVAALDALAEAQIGALVIRDGRRFVAPDQQPSLVFVLCEGAAECFWSSVPVLQQE